MPPATPTAIGRYQVRALLGSGAFGSVYRAFDPQLERDIALKVLRPEMTASSQAVERFLREAKAAAKLRHPHIVPVHDAGRAGTVYYIASAYIAGRTLASAIPEGGVDPRLAAEWAAQLASALGYAHKHGVLHRDVKPANAMLDEGDALQLMDFGLAGWTQEETTRLTQTGTVMGTPMYMSPEQACGETADIGPASDVYSAGVVLYQMLTGSLPFEAPNAAALVYRIVHTAAPHPSQLRPGLDPVLEEICLKAMARRPADRFATGGEMAAALRRWLGPWDKEPLLPPSPRPASSTTDPPSGPVSRPTTRRRFLSASRFALLAGAAVILLLGIACTGVGYLFFPSPPPPATILPPAVGTTIGPQPTGVPPEPPGPPEDLPAAPLEGQGQKWPGIYSGPDSPDHLSSPGSRP